MKKGCLITLLIGFSVITIIVAIGFITDWGRAGKPDLPAFEDIETKVYDIGAKSQITRHIIIQDSTVSKDELSYLLETLVKANENYRMKYNGGKPTHISVYIHTTKESFDSGI